MFDSRFRASGVALLAAGCVWLAGVSVAGAQSVATTAVVAAAPPAAPAKAAEADPLSRFFRWWNATFLVPGGYTAEAFGQWFTPDATLTIDGREVIRGVDGWASHFTRIQSGGGQVEIVVPFKQVFQAGNRIYTYHVINSRRDGKVSCMLAAGHAELRGDRIASIVLVRTALDPAKAPLDPQCWTD